MRKINCILLDDEPFARKGIVAYISDIPFLQLQASYSSAVEVMQTTASVHYDLVFLDIEMPRIDGLTYLKSLKNPPLVIIITAFPQYALEGFELDVIDYLVKPVSFDKFLKASQKAYEYLNRTSQPSTEEHSSYFFIKENKKIKKLFFKDILYVESLQNYIKIVTENSHHITYLTLKEIDENLKGKGFIKIHKSFVVSIDKVIGIEGNTVLLGNKKLPISKERRKEIIEGIVGNNLWKRE